MSGVRRRASGATVALAALLGACRCGAPSGPASDGSLPDRELDAQVDASRPDSHVDAGRPDAWGDAAPCDATFIALPPLGDSFISRVSNWGRWVAYDYEANYGDWADIYLYDLETCTTHRITNDPTLLDWQPSMWQDQVVFSSQLDPNFMTTVRHEIGSGIRTDFPTTNALAVSILGAMGDYVAYATLQDAQPSSPILFNLLHMPTGQSTLLQSSEDGASSGGDISETHFTWPSLVQNEHRGIWIVEFAQGQISKLDGSGRGTYPTT